jgi:hypothetical protein
MSLDSTGSRYELMVSSPNRIINLLVPKEAVNILIK